MWVGARERRPAPAHRRLPAVRLDPRRHDAAGVVRRRGAGRGLDLVAGPGRQPVGLVGRPRRRRGGRPAGAGRSARTSTRCPTAAPSTARWAWCRRSRRVDALRADGFRPARPIGVANFADEEGARFGIACAGSRLITGALDADRARGAARRRRHDDGRGDGRGRARPGRTSAPTRETLRRVGTFVELHVEQGRGLVDLDRAGRRRQRDLAARPVAARPRRARPTTPAPPRLEDRHDPMLGARRDSSWRRARPRRRHGCVATVGKVARRARRRQRHPVAGHRLARRPRRRRGAVRAVVAERRRAGRRREPRRGVLDAATRLRPRRWPRTVLAGPLGAAPRCSATGAGHDAGILATAGVVDGDAVRAQPHRGLALARRSTPSPTTACRRRGARRASSRDLAGRATSVRRTGAEHAWLPTRPRRRDVRLEVGDGAVHRGRRPAAARRGRRAARRAWCFPGFANAHSHAFHRALRGRTHGGGGTFWTWRERMYAVAARLDPDTLPRPGPRDVRRDGAGRDHRASASSTTCTTARAARRTPTPTRWARRCAQAAGDAGIRLTLLDTCYLAGGLTGDGHLPLDARAAAVLRRRRRARGPTRVGACCPRRRRCGSARRSTRCAPCRAASARRSVGACRGAAPLHVHLSEQPAENEACRGVLRLHADRAARRRRACSARARRPCTPPT